MGGNIGLVKLRSLGFERYARVYIANYQQGVTVKENPAHLICNVFLSPSAGTAVVLHCSYVLKGCRDSLVIHTPAAT